MQEYPKIETLLDRDATNFRVVPGMWRTPEFKYLQHNEWVWTEKVDGTNVRVEWAQEKQQVTFGGKTEAATIPSPLLRRLQDLFPVKLFESIYSDLSLCLYGEGYGKKIQKGGERYISDGVDFVLFDIWINGFWLERVNLQDIARKMGLRIVPIAGRGNLLEAIDYAKKGFSSAWGDFNAEGLVLKPLVEMLNRKGERIIGKIKEKDF